MRLLNKNMKQQKMKKLSLLVMRIKKEDKQEAEVRYNSADRMQSEDGGHSSHSEAGYHRIYAWGWCGGVESIMVRT